MKIAVGTKNPVKIDAVRTAFQTMLPDEAFEIIGVDVSSGVSDQPMSDEESIKGARVRAKNAFKEVPDADIAIGLEGGLQQVGDLCFTGNLACAVTKDGRTGYGISPKVAAPAELIHQVEQGKNLSEAVESVLGIADIGKKEGLLGYMTNGHVTRKSASAQSVIAAAMRLLLEQAA